MLAQIKQAILASHMRSGKKVVHWVQRQIPQATEKQILDVLETIQPKDFRHLSGTETTTHYYTPIFTPFIGGFQIDLIQSSNKPTSPQDQQLFPRYFFVAINTNTRYAYAYPMRHKRAVDVLAVLPQWLNDVNQTGAASNHRKLVYITADLEPAWQSAQVNAWLQAQGIKIRLIPSDRHSALGIIDRFIRTLRDMNTRTTRGADQGGVGAGDGHQGEPREFRDFTPRRMARFIAIHNNALHTATGMTPTDMENNRGLQKEYIIRKLYEVNRREKISDFDLAVGSWVRYMIPRDMMKKRRWAVSSHVVRIQAKVGRAYRLVAQDGTTNTMARWRLFPVKNPNEYTELESWV
jgi:hypothetical protein